MGDLRFLSALASAGLAMSLLAIPTPGEPIAEQPCPILAQEPPGPVPPPPTPPSHGPGERQLGGPAMAAQELVVPPGSPQPPTITATTWLVADLDSGAVLGGCGPHEHATPASVQKLLLAAALLPVLDPDEVVEVTAEDMAFEPGSSAVGLVVGGEYSIETLWLGLMLSSGNDAANVLARLGGGDMAGGVALMNEEAQRLGAFQTHAATPSGLDGPGQFTSAYDLALISRQLFDREDFLRYTGTERTDIPAQPAQNAPGFQVQNDNGLLLNYPGALGGKTGFTDLARHTFVGAAERDGRRLVATLLGAEAQPLRGWQQAAQLLDWGFSLPPDAAVGRLVEPEEVASVAASSTQEPAEGAEGPAASPTGSAQGPATNPVSMAAAGVAAFAAGGIVVVLALVTRRRRG